jgi:hypothetical protein
MLEIDGEEATLFYRPVLRLRNIAREGCLSHRGLAGWWAAQTRGGIDGRSANLYPAGRPDYSAPAALA